VLKLYKADGTTEVTPIANSMVQLKWRDASGGQVGGDEYNIGNQRGTNTEIPPDVITAGGVAKIDFETGEAWAASEARYIEIISIKFHH
jgi:hypothetical protein